MQLMWMTAVLLALSWAIIVVVAIMPRRNANADLKSNLILAKWEVANDNLRVDVRENISQPNAPTPPQPSTVPAYAIVLLLLPTGPCSNNTRFSMP